MVENRSQREGVFRWFSSLTSAQRAEFLCGLLDLCVPIELRFLGACLEDLARKDYHSLRDAEIRANNPADLSGLTNITDEVVRSKLLVSLALMGSDNRDAAGVLYRTLTHIDSVINNYGLALNDGRTEEQFLLLFTMASNHPAFTFHQKQVLRRLLLQIQETLQASGEREAPGLDPAICPPHHQHLPPAVSSCPPPDPVRSPPPTCHFCLAHATCWHKSPTREAGPGPGSEGPMDPSLHLEAPPPQLPVPLLPAGPGQNGSAAKSLQSKAGKAVLERVVLRGATHKSEEASEFIFEATWSDGFVSSVVRNRSELTDLLTQLSKVFPDLRLEKTPPPSAEVDPRCLTSLPCHILQHHSVQLFFTSTGPLAPKYLSTASHPSSSPFLPRLLSSLPAAPAVPPCPFTSGTSASCSVQFRGANRAVYRVASIQPVVSAHSSVLTRSTPQLSCLPPALPRPQLSSLPPPVPALPSGGEAPSQHLHPPSYSHLHLHPAAPPSPSHPRPPPQTAPPEQNGILDWLRKLRLHKYYPVFKQLTMEEFLALTEEDLNKYDLTQGAKKKLKTQLELHKSADRELKLEKRPCGGIARVPPSCHMGPPTHSCAVEGDPHHPDSSPSSGYSSSPCSPHTHVCCSSDRSRDRRAPSEGGGPDKDRPCVFILGSGCSAVSTRPTAQVLPVQTDPPRPPAPVPPPHFRPQSCVLASPRKPRPEPQDPRGGLMVDTSSALTSTSNSLHHVSHPPLHFHLSSSSPPSPSVYYSFPPTSSLSTVSSRSQSGSSVGTVPGTSFFHPPEPGPGHSSSMCVCSSCGCRGNCGAYATLPGYAAAAGYLQPFSAGPSLFTLGPLLHLSPLPVSSSSAPAAGPFSYQMMAPPPFYRQAAAAQEQKGFYQPYPAQKRTAGNPSCYNCGASGHSAEDCREPAMEAQQGSFRLKFTSHSDTTDSAD
ncbi:zinc finger CCHC domain-containing protein 14 isoform X1 [Synchiropus splendidus]|uniref:zinc finger CCHC domain-containing protein 14 isoform X1 n=1 Tax=Synchiropus splendidus TaxID=270530 RepID=UPI00237E2EF5|nr:zinc finger CCHC domain-containing protein 14 isoform X1 [Synchiropus splendidus]